MQDAELLKRLGVARSSQEVKGMSLVSRSQESFEETDFKEEAFKGPLMGEETVEITFYIDSLSILEGTIRVLGILSHLDLAMGRGWIFIFTTFPFFETLGGAVTP